MDQSPPESTGIRFANPPVSEVIISLEFEPIALPLVGYGVMVDHFRQVYPTQREGPGPRGVQLLSEDESQILQLDPERITANWRRRDRPYPGNSYLHQRFEADLKAFSNYLEQLQLSTLNPRTLLLAYTNQVPIPEAQPYADLLQKIFPDIGWRREPNRKLPVPSGVNWQTIFHPDPSCVLNVYLQAPALALEGRLRGTPVIRFDFVAQAEATGETSHDEVLGWFCRAHEWILTTFQELTSEDFRIEHWSQLNEGA